MYYENKLLIPLHSGSKLPENQSMETIRGPTQDIFNNKKTYKLKM